MKDIVQELVNLGFSSSEAAVYVATLQLGYADIQSIKTKSGISRATVYTALKNLESKGLMRNVRSEDKQRFKAEDPGAVVTLLEMQQRELSKRVVKAQHIVERLSVFHNAEGSKPRIRFYERVAGLRAMQMEYESLDEDIIQIVSLDTLKKVYGQASRGDHVYELQNSEKRVRSIIVTREDVSHLSKLENFEYVVADPDLVPIQGEMSVCGDRLALFSYASFIIAVEVQSQVIADTARATLELAWNEAVRLSRIGMGE